MHLLFYIVAFVTSEGGDWGTTRRSSCLHKGVRVPNVRYLIMATLQRLADTRVGVTIPVLAHTREKTVRPTIELQIGLSRRTGDRVTSVQAGSRATLIIAITHERMQEQRRMCNSTGFMVD